MEQEETNLLMMNVLKIHFKDRLHVLDDILGVLKDFSSKEASTQLEYDETTAILKGMLNDLPEDILSYFLTLIPVSEDNNTLQLNNFNSGDIKTIMLNYVNGELPVIKEADSPPEKKTRCDDTSPNESEVGSVADVEFVVETNASSASSTSLAPSISLSLSIEDIKKPRRKRRFGRWIKPNIECKNLLDICAEYVVRNHSALYQAYQSKNAEVWRLLRNSKRFSADELNRVYTAGKYINKRLKWLRLLEAEDITDEIIFDSYYDEAVLIQESEYGSLLEEDPFYVTQQLENTILRFAT